MKKRRLTRAEVDSVAEPLRLFLEWAEKWARKGAVKARTGLRISGEEKYVREVFYWEHFDIALMVLLDQHRDWAKRYLRGEEP